MNANASECKDCLYWSPERPTAKVGTCKLLSEMGVMNVPRRAMSTSAVLTREDFGCNDFAEKPLQETVAE